MISGKGIATRFQLVTHPLANEETSKNYVTIYTGLHKQTMHAVLSAQNCYTNIHNKLLASYMRSNLCMCREDQFSKAQLKQC